MSQESNYAAIAHRFPDLFIYAVIASATHLILDPVIGYPGTGYKKPLHKNLLFVFFFVYLCSP